MLGSRVLQNLYFVLDSRAERVGMRNKEAIGASVLMTTAPVRPYNHTRSTLQTARFVGRVLPLTLAPDLGNAVCAESPACRGDQTFEEADNTCKDPQCSTYFFHTVGSDKTCEFVRDAPSHTRRAPLRHGHPTTPSIRAHLTTPSVHAHRCNPVVVVIYICCECIRAAADCRVLIIGVAYATYSARARTRYGKRRP